MNPLRLQPDYKNVPLRRPEPQLEPEEPKLLDALIEDIVGEDRRERELRDQNPLFNS